MIIPALCFVAATLCINNAQAQTQRTDTMKYPPKTNNYDVPRTNGDSANRSKTNPNTQPLNPTPVTPNTNRNNTNTTRPDTTQTPGTYRK